MRQSWRAGAVCKTVAFELSGFDSHLPYHTNICCYPICNWNKVGFKLTSGWFNEVPVWIFNVLCVPGEWSKNTLPIHSRRSWKGCCVLWARRMGSSGWVRSAWKNNVCLNFTSGGIDPSRCGEQSWKLLVVMSGLWVRVLLPPPTGCVDIYCFLTTPRQTVRKRRGSSDRGRWTLLRCPVQCR